MVRRPILPKNFVHDEMKTLMEDGLVGSDSISWAARPPDLMALDLFSMWID